MASGRVKTSRSASSNTTNYQGPNVKTLLRLFALASIVQLIPSPMRADENVVRSGSMLAFPMSFALGGGSNYVAGAMEEVYFTTPDGKTTIPKTIKEEGGELKGTDEFVPGANPGEWKTDYFVTGLVGTKIRIVEFGSLQLNYSTADVNSNHVPDIVDAMAPFHGVSAGIRTVDWMAPGRSTSAIPDNYQIQIDRNANALRGTWMYGTPGNAIAGGYYETPYAQGSINYYRADTKNYLDFYFSFPFQYTGKTFYSATDPDHLSVKGVTFLGSGLKPIKAMPFSLVRDGHTYSGMVKFIDGGTTTPIKDYTWWMFTLTDPNDTDSDGTSNLSDYRALRFTKQPVSKTLKIGANYTLSAAYRPFGKDPIGTVEAQWLRNSSPISGATELKYTIRDFNLSLSGDYQLRLHSGAGYFYSNTAKIDY
jgi:hypothetical protein